MPGFPGPVPASTALCFAALCAALLMIRFGRTATVARFAAGVSLSVLLVTFGILARHVGDVFSSWTLQPGQMSNTEAFALVLLALGTSALGLRSASHLLVHAARACACMAVMVCLLVLADAQAAAAARLLPAAVIRPGTAVLLIALALAVVEASSAQLVPTALHKVNEYAAWSTTLLAALVFVAWAALEGKEWREREADTGIAHEYVTRDLLARMETRATALQRLALRTEIYGALTQEQFEGEARQYLQDFSGVNALIFTDTSYVVLWRVARVRSEELVGTSIGIDDGRLAAFESAARTRRVQLSSPVGLLSGGDGLVLVAPVFDGAALRGFITTSIRVAEVYGLIEAPLLRRFTLTVKDGPKVILGAPGAPLASSEALARHANVQLLGRRWDVALAPNPGYLESSRSRLPDTVFWLGLAGALLVGAAFVQSRRSYLHGMAARDLSARLESTLESITDAFFTVDAQWRFIYVNRQAEQLLRRPRDGLIGLRIWEEFPEAVGSGFQQKCQQAIETRVTVEFEEYFAPLGKWFRVRAYPTPEDLAVYFQDVTEIVRSREALIESERELRALAESMPQIIWMSTPEGDASYFNERWVDFSGLSLADSYGGGWTACIHPEDLVRLRSAWREARRHGTYLSTEARLRRVDGTFRWMLVRSIPFRARAGATLKWMGTCTDIDDLKRSAEAIRASEERFRLLTRATRDAVLDADLQTGSLWWNEAFELQFGHSRATMAGTLDAWSQAIHPDDRERVLPVFGGHSARPDTVWSAEFRYQRASGEWASVLARGCLILDNATGSPRMLAWMTDVSERLALEDRLRQSQRLESLGQLTGGVAHDFNNLLTVIIGNAEVLQQELGGEARLSALARMIVEAADRGADLTQRLLAFARRQALAPLPLEIHAAIDNLQPLLERTLGGQVRLAVEPHDRALWALIDPTQFDNAILNLSLNARDAMPDGGTLRIAVGEMRVERTHGPDVPEGDYVSISVSDTGCGIAPQHLERLFEPFFTTKERGKGTGLGLAMVYGFIRQSGGTIEVQSRPGAGTMFRILLPQVECASEVEVTPVPSDPEIQGGNERVLLVEDEEAVRLFARGQLQSLGYQVVDVGDPGQAIELLRAGETFDILFTDVVMPGMTGPALVRVALSLQPQLKVLFSSGYVEDSFQESGFGEDDPPLLLAKPYRRGDLARYMRMALARPS